MQDFKEADRLRGRLLQDGCLQLRQAIRGFVQIGFDDNAGPGLAATVAHGPLWIPLEQKIGHKDLPFACILLIGRGERQLIEVCPCLLKGLLELAVGKIQQISGEPVRCITLPLPWRVLGGRCGIEAALLELLAAATGATVISTGLFACRQRHCPRVMCGGRQGKLWDRGWRLRDWSETHRGKRWRCWTRCWTQGRDRLGA